MQTKKMQDGEMILTMRTRRSRPALQKQQQQPRTFLLMPHRRPFISHPLVDFSQLTPANHLLTTDLWQIVRLATTSLVQRVAMPARHQVALAPLSQRRRVRIAMMIGSKPVACQILGIWRSGTGAWRCGGSLFSPWPIQLSEG